MCASISDQFKNPYQNIDKLTRHLNLPSTYYNIDALNSLSNSAKAIASSFYFPTKYLNEITAASKAVQNVYLPTNVSNAITASINSLSIPIKAFEMEQFTKSQAYENALMAMRAFSTQNNYINRQWNSLIKTELSDQFMTSFMNASKTRLSKSTGLSENDLEFMQNAINETYKNNDTSVDVDHISENLSTDNRLNQEQDQSNNISDENKEFQHTSPAFFVWLFIFLAPTVLFIDGNIRHNNQEVLISAAIEMTFTAFDRIKDELK